MSTSICPICGLRKGKPYSHTDCSKQLLAQVKPVKKKGRFSGSPLTNAQIDHHMRHIRYLESR